MAHNINYSELNFANPIRIINYDSKFPIIQWLLAHSQIAGGWIKFLYFDKSDVEMTAIATAVPTIGTVTRDLQSFMKVLYHVAEMGRFTAEEVGNINDAVVAWSDQAVAVLTSYHPGGVPPPNSSNYWLLAHWAKLSFDTIKFLLNKTKDACTLVDSFKELRAAVDTLNPVLNKMSIGRATKQGAQEAGEATIKSQDLCFAAVNAYFSHTLPYDDDETVHKLPTTADCGCLCHQ